MKSRGFTLVELIISIVVISLVIGTSVSMSAKLSRATVMPDVLNISTFLAERELERVNQKRFSAIANEGPTNYTEAPFTDYSWQIQVSAPPAGLGLGTTTARAKQVVVIINHAVYGAVSLSTLVSNN